MSDVLWSDAETRSRANLKVVGLYNYMADPSTEAVCVCYAFNDEPVQTWRRGEPIPDRLRNFKGQIRAFNAAFERLLFEMVMGLPFKLEQFYCCAAEARANCCPGSLEDLGRFAGLNLRKDRRGSQLIRALGIPREDGTFNEDSELHKEFELYCARDVETMREGSKGLRSLTAEEWADYITGERINDRGVLLDKPLAEAAVKYAAQETQDIQELVREITNGEVNSVRSPKMRDWVYNRLGDTGRELMVHYKDGERKVSIDKAVRANLLVLAEENNNEVPPYVADVIQCADDIWSSSVAKFSRAAALADMDDNRVRGAFVFAGGAATGRASSYGLQVHNYPRKTAADPEAVRDAVVNGRNLVPDHGPTVNSVLKSMLRPSLIAAPGKKLVIADWSSIEARVTPWASGRGDRKLDLFRTGVDIYKVNAAAKFGCAPEEVDDHQRQVGKVMELASGFAGGANALHNMARIYGLSFTDDEAWSAINAWRRANPWAPRYWSELEDAYTRAMRNPGHEFKAGRVTYLYDGVHLWYALPSGRILRYPYARFDEDGISYAKCSWKPAADATEWPRARLWKGLVTENVTQAIANDVLRAAMRPLEGLGVVLHIHDELVVECDAVCAEDAAARMRLHMTTPPPWAEGLPLAIGEPKISERYVKG